MNVAARPVAGSIGLVSQPIEGAVKSMYKTSAETQERTRRSIRIFDGVAAVKKSSPEERANVLEAFQLAKLTTKDRKKKLHYEASLWFREQHNVEIASTSSASIS